MSESHELDAASMALLTDTRGGAVSDAAQPYFEAMQCLREAAVPFAVMRDDPEGLHRVRDLDLLIDVGELKIAFAALRRAGFREKRTPHLERKWVFLRYDSDRWYVLDVHGAFVQAGMEYMDAALALGRRDTSGWVPLLSREDRFLHILLHNLLGKTRLQEKHLPQLRQLRRAKLNLSRLDQQTHRFGTGDVVQQALEDLNALAKDEKRWRRLRKQARRVLLRRPGNRMAHWRYRNAGRFRLWYRPVIVALLGPDGTGKTSLADALEDFLADSPLRAGRVYMGSWGHDHLPMRLVRRLIPPKVSHGRMFAALSGRSVNLTAGERRLLEEERPSRFRMRLRAARYGIKNALFHIGLLAELGYRYLRHIARCKRPIVITDRWVYDLEFRQGRTPFTYGEGMRRFIYRLVPRPDGVLYLSAPYEVVAARKPQLDREQFETMDQHFRRFLKKHRPLELVTDVPVDELARTFLTRYWVHLLERHNQRT